MRMMAEELKSVGINVSELELLVRIIQTLPPSYRYFISAWESVQPAQQTLANLTARLITEELRSKTYGTDASETAFFASHPSRTKQQQSDANAARSKDTRSRGEYSHRKYRNSHDYRGGSFQRNDNTYRSQPNRGGSRGRGGRGRGGRLCYICGRTNHKAYNCWEKKDEDRREARNDLFDKKRDSNSSNNDDNKSFCALSSLCFISRRSNDWYADSGATHHMTDQRSFFSKFKEIQHGSWVVNGIGGSELLALGIGTVPIYSYVHGERKLGEFKDVLFVPNLGTSLYSIGVATESHIEAHFTNNNVTFVKNDTEIMSGQRIGKSLYHLKVIARTSNQDSSSTVATSSEKSLHHFKIWHQRLAHINNKAILKMIKLNAVAGLDLGVKDPIRYLCEGCIFGKLCRSPFTSSTTKSEDVGDILHSDIGIIPIPTPTGERYYAIYKDDCSNWSATALLRKKSDAGKFFMKFIAFILTATGKKVKIVRTDGGKEYNNNIINDYYTANGIVHQVSNVYTPQQNGVSERMNRTAIEATRSSLHMRSNRFTNMFKVGDPAVLELWGEFLRSAIYVLNRTLSCSSSSNSSTKTPYELFFKQKPDISHLRVIGCRAYVHIPDAKHMKLESKGIPCWLVGYGEETKGWRMWDPVTRKFIISRDVTFDEDLLISDITDDHKQHTQKQPDYTRFDPFFLATEILSLVFFFYLNFQ